MTKSELFKAAHKVARQTKKLVGDYMIAFKLALLDLYKEIKLSLIAIKEVFIYWSESSTFNSVFGCDKNFNINKRVSITDYEQAARSASFGIDMGYDKTKVKLILSNGQQIDHRHDISATNNSLIQDWDRWVEYCNKNN